jgi:hypothetical protein
LRAAKGISRTLQHHQTCQSWALKKEKRWKPKEYVIYSTN